MPQKISDQGVIVGTVIDLNGVMAGFFYKPRITRFSDAAFSRAERHRENARAGASTINAMPVANIGTEPMTHITAICLNTPNLLTSMSLVPSTRSHWALTMAATLSALLFSATARSRPS